MSQWKSFDDKVKHCNGSLDSLHIKTNVLDTQIKQVISKQTDQSASIESRSSIVTSLQDRVEELENNRGIPNNNLSQVSKTKCDVLILGDSILRRIQPKRFTPQGKTVVRFIRGGAKTCTSFVKKNGQRFEPKNILIHIGTRDLQGEGVKEDEFPQLFDQCTKTWNNSSIYVLPIISRKDIHDDIVNQANNTIELVCDLYPSIHKIEPFEPSYDMFHDDVYLNYGKGLPAIVKHLKIALNISIHKQHQTTTKSKTGISRDVFVAVVNVSPEYSSHNNNDIESKYSIVLSEVEKYSSLGDIIIQGDFYAYTNTQLDFIEFDNVTG
ncbi:unnamed protein product [Mytilus coruscus]|uniref:SGNH hydrolase-type esterase domain-containing protein n=1 Tax=Mytilus coruscus TaxID=42192 RepID=A0A6J8D7S4_MYTCO|nr:unnamed protein product [Mytilus coruscus]